jgi:malonyl-CoA/methylmalonyl-CoA synthetase
MGVLPQGTEFPPGRSNGAAQDGSDTQGTSMANPLFDRLFGAHAGSTRPFLHLEDGGTITYQDFLSLAAQYAHVLTRKGLQPGDRVAAQIEKTPQALVLYAACVQAGAVFLPLNTAYTIDELGYFIENSGARIVLCDGRREAMLAPLVARLGGQVETINADGSGTIADQARLMPRAYPTVARTADDLAALLYTSGTTGRSKGAMLTQGNLLSNAETLAVHWHFDRDDVLLHALPIFHTHGLFVATNVTLVTGGAMIFLPRFDLDRVMHFLPRATVMMGVPTFYTRLLDDPRLTPGLVAHMRLFISGSAPLLAETHVRFEARTGKRILERYGMTETNMNTSNPYDGERRAGTVGFPLPGVEVKITDPDTGADLPPGEIGQIEVRGPNVFKGYWQMPEKTAAELRVNGYFITGDLGRIDADGYLQIVGRNKDLIISGGYNIYPKEIEQLLDEQPGVLESAVIGVPHPDFGETVLALLVARPQETPDIQAITAAIGTSLARFKHPRKIIVLEELPRNTMGKVQKNILRERYAGLFA